VPTFEEVLEFAKGKIDVYIDAKRISAADPVAAVRKFGLEDQVVFYGNMELHRGVQKLEPRIKVMPEARSVETATSFIEELHPRVIASTRGTSRTPSSRWRARRRRTLCRPVRTRG
jgi:glycerophosphoryl diester phosphodiesterase